MTGEGRPALSREHIAETALRLTEDSGLAGLSMRKLGAELGVEAMSLYHYVANKDDLLDAMLDLLYGEVELPRDVGDDEWEQAIRDGLTSFRQVLLRHSAAIELFASRPPPTERALEVLYWSYRRFELVGLSPEDSLLAFRFIVSFVMGNAANEIGVMGRSDDDLIDLDSLSDPALRNFLIVRRSVGEPAYFDVGLDVVIAGLRARFNLPDPQ
ncbi:MAG: TetR/AcrR family transcriptional regulator C-terminal domain-containing protein [Actinomycetota bacterium]